MTDVWGALGQALPTAGALTDAYTVPTAHHSTVEAVICNRGVAAVVRLSHAINGAADTGAQYILYDFPVGAAETKVTARFTAKAGDVIRVRSDTGTVAFNINGIQEAD